MIIRQFEINNIRQLVMHEIKGDCSKPEVVLLYSRSFPIVRLGHLVSNIWDVGRKPEVKITMLYLQMQMLFQSRNEVTN